MRGLAWLPVAFGAVLVILAGAVDRSLARLSRAELSLALAEAPPEQQRAALQLATALRQAQDALQRGEAPAGLRAWTVQRPPSPSASAAEASPVGSVDRAALALRLSSQGVTRVSGRRERESERPAADLGSVASAPLAT